jgi:hypothetical protein
MMKMNMLRIQMLLIDLQSLPTELAIVRQSTLALLKAFQQPA